MNVMEILAQVERFIPTLQAISIIIAAISFIYGINAWRREFIGKRKIELAEKVLSLFYEARDAIKYMRNIFGNSEESKTRKRSEFESNGQSRLLDQAYVVFERYQKNEKVFAELNSLKYRVMTVFGAEYVKPFNDLNFIIRDIFTAANLMGIYSNDLDITYGKRKSELLEKIKENEKIRWYMFDENDDIENRLNNIISEVEKLTKEVVNRKSNSSY